MITTADVPATEGADVLSFEAGDVVDNPEHIWIDTHGTAHKTIDNNVGKLLEAGYAWEQLQGDAWIVWVHSLGKWVLVTSNEDAMNALLSASGVEHRVEYEDTSLIGQIPDVAKDVAEDVKDAVSDVWDTTKIVGMVILGGVALFLIGKAT